MICMLFDEETKHSDFLEQVTVNSLESCVELIHKDRGGWLLIIIQPFIGFFFIRQAVYYHKKSGVFEDLTFDDDYEEYIKEKCELFCKIPVYSFKDPLIRKVY